ncbi:MAG: class II aldolase/adducin family protein [Rhodospirillales bacterium]|jgi:L-fuculose-phosphate aldolase/L-ribulose-5-phosphate 4-epimerase|nr:class II aldolase/adducin family protein [Nitrospinaceae bacterium]MDP7624423.1 class II aldolase/adducin family protein [Rhodospirillales bacterium]|tara:strand:- start:91 stop:696 length:606 start_codon:yes stop_codon:yes gene_type:complete
MNTDDIVNKKQELIRIAERCFHQGLQTGSGGNISIRLTYDDAIVIKPSGVGFAECTVENLMVADLEGNIISGELKPSKDMDFHLAIYRVRPDVNGIVHVHSPWATAWASGKQSIPCLTIHAAAKLKSIPVIPVAGDGGAQTASEVTPVFRNPECKAALMEYHGSVGVGKTLLAAQHVAELIEETAQIAAVSRMISSTGESA